MSSVDVEKLLEPISPEQPCGENLEYDADFGELERAAQGKPDQQYGDTKVEAEEPDWRDVRDRSLELFGRTKDLRIALYLTRSVLRTDGLAGFRDALAVVRGLVERYWQELHPQLDPDDGLDPALRINTLATLNDSDAVLRALMEAALVDSAVGRFAFRDYLTAQGEMPPRPEQAPTEMSTLESAFGAADGEAVLATAAAAQGALDDATATETAVTEQVGVSQAVSLDDCCGMLRRMAKFTAEQVERLGLNKTAEEPAADDSGELDFTGGNGEELVADGEEGAAPARRQKAFDEVRTRDDVIRLLDKICDYYRDNEPSSPVPILLRRAKRVATMDFLELLRELAPGGLAEVELLKGSADGDASETS